MLRMTCAAATLACALVASTSASAQSFSLSIGTRPLYGGYGYYAPSSYYGGGFYDQRYYGDWRDYRGRYYVQPHYDYHQYPFPHFDLHYGRHYHGYHGHHHHGGHRH